MYDKVELLQLTNTLAERINNLRTAILSSSIYGGSNSDLQKQTLQRTTSELVHAVRSGADRQVVIAKASDIEGQLQTAAATGLIGDSDLQSYLGTVDTIYTALDQEN